MNTGAAEVKVLPPHSSKDMSIGRILLDSGKIKPEDAERVLRLQKERGIRFGEAAQKLGLITEEDIQNVLARQFDYPYLQPGQGSFPQELVAAYQPFSTEVETLRALRSQLMLRWFGTGRRALAIMSIDAEDDAAMLTANLAVVFSQLGEQTLLVDANMRKPEQHRIFNIKEKMGLSDVLAGRADASAISKVESFVDLSVLTAGTTPPNPQELLGRSSFTALNDRIASQFDVVLYASPSVAVGADAYAIAAKLRGVVLIVRKNKSRVNEIRAVSEQLARSGVEIVGSIMLNY